MDMQSTSTLTRARTLALIGAATGIGCALPETARAPAWLRDHGLIDHLTAQGVMVAWSAIIAADADGASDVVTRIARSSGRLARAVEAAMAADSPFAVLGGDHSCAIGTWSGAARAVRARGPLGLIWVDAHMDSHVPETSPSGFYHGMPLACLLGHGPEALTSVADGAPALTPGHVGVVGVRSYEPQEAALLERLGVRVFYMTEVAERGLAAVMRDASRVAFTGTVAAGISIDLDALDPREAPSVGSAVPGGLSVDALAAALAGFARDPRVIGCEIVEFNPALAGAEKTAGAIETLLAAFQGRGR